MPRETARTTEQRPSVATTYANGAEADEYDPERREEMYTLSFVLAQAAVGTVRAAAGVDKGLRRNMDRKGLIDAAFLLLESNPPPPEARKWLKEHFANNGAATAAIERQLETILRKHFMAMLVSEAPSCWPFCGSGYHTGPP